MYYHYQRNKMARVIKGIVNLDMAINLELLE